CVLAERDEDRRNGTGRAVMARRNDVQHLSVLLAQARRRHPCATDTPRSDRSGRCRRRSRTAAAPRGGAPAPAGALPRAAHPPLRRGLHAGGDRRVAVDQARVRKEPDFEMSPCRTRGLPPSPPAALMSGHYTNAELL